jgi:hypothetical protein
MVLSRERANSRKKGQALTELLVVLPVLLLLLLAAAEMGKLFVISGKSEISARYSALRHFREYPFEDVYPAHDRPQEIERLFFDDALDDRAQPEAEGTEEDDPDVTYDELGDPDLDYAPGSFGNEVVVLLWDTLMDDDVMNLTPIRGARSIFAYDLPAFPYGRGNPMGPTLPLEDGGSGVAPSYEASGNFVMVADSFSGDTGVQVRIALELAGLAVGAQITSGFWAAYAAALWWFLFLP